MKREFLEQLGLEKEVIDKVMAEYGKSIQELKLEQEKFDELKNEKTTLEQQLNQLQNTLSAKEEELKSVDELKQQVESYKLKDLKTNIAFQAGIPIELAEKLSGETEEEIKADAEKLAGFISNKKTVLPDRTTEPPKIDEKEQAFEKLLENLD